MTLGRLELGWFAFCLQGLETALHAAVSSAAEHSEHDRLRMFAESARRYTRG